MIINSAMLRITIHLNDGRILAGTYPCIDAILRVERAKKSPLYHHCEIEGPFTSRKGIEINDEAVDVH